MRSVPTTVPEVDEWDVLAVPDLWERARLAGELAKQFQAAAAAMLCIRRDAACALVRSGERQSRVARHLSLSPTRINQWVGPVQDARAAAAVA